MKKLLMLGGGPTNLALAEGLADSGLNPDDVECVLIERGNLLGGQARTEKWAGNGLHDLGPHKVFSIDQNLMQKVLSLLPAEQWLRRPKSSSIFLGGKYLPYPPSPFSLIGIYGWRRFSKMVLDFGIAKLGALKGGGVVNSFADDVKQRVGRTLFQVMFEPMARKLWDDPEVLDQQLSKGRVQTPSLTEVFLRLARLKKTSKFEAIDFFYPKGGLQGLWSRIENQFCKIGQIKRNVEVVALEAKDHTLKRVVTRSLETGQETAYDIGPEDIVFSSLPLGEMPRLMRTGLPEKIRQTIRDYVGLNDLALVFLKVDVTDLLKECWVFVPDPSMPFHRVSEQESFDPSMTPDGSIVCCEIMDSRTRPILHHTDQELEKLSIEGLRSMGYQFSVRDQKVVRLPQSYPVYRKGFEQALHEILDFFDAFDNLKTIGRQGAFNYIGTLDCMDIGFGAANWYSNRTLNDALPLWKAERKRTEFYPVLD